MSYVRSKHRWGLGRARANRISGLGNSRGRLGDVTDYMPLFTTAINDAASVASVALRPPTYSAVTNPYTGTSTVTSYGAIPGTSPYGSNPVTAGLETLLADPIMVWLGIGLIAFVVMKR